MVPNGWALLTVGDIFDVQLGKMLNKEAKKKQPQLRYLGNSNVRWGEFELTELNSMYFSEREINKYKLEFNDILVCEGGEVGRCAIWEQHNSQILYQKALHRLRVKGEVVPKYFQNYMQSIAGTKLLEDYTSRTSIAHLTREKLLSLPIKLPPLSEQQKIAKILSTWDKAISTTERLIENSIQQKKALMQQLLTGKNRLLDDEGKRFEGEWEEVKLGEISHITTGNSNREDSSLTGKYAFFDRSIDVRTSGIFLFDAEAVIVGGEGQDFVPKYFEGKFDLHQRTYAIMDFKNAYGKFLFYYIGYYRYYFLSQAVGSTVKSLRLPMFQKMPIKLPSVKEQQKIATVLTNADKEIELLEQQLADLQQEKKALMQVLLTGKKRVVVDGEVA
ncbi:restriction endonuclease subunit S [Psychrobacter faecalis]|uniref:restriction endonuclease subunit S n=1 Tax=Psychrobacter faecalis TaxID=180588 RepID=UPI0018DF1A37|nr:restriction endonuclease subunit S [Psychrobacter faecalis]